MSAPELESRVSVLEREVRELKTQLEKSRVAARIQRGLEQADRGQTLPAHEALESLRMKYNVPRQ